MKRVDRSRAQVFQVQQEAHQKLPAKVARKLRGHKKKIKLFLVQNLVQTCLHHATRRSDHEGTACAS